MKIQANTYSNASGHQLKCKQIQTNTYENASRHKQTLINMQTNTYQNAGKHLAKYKQSGPTGRAWKYGCIGLVLGPARGARLSQGRPQGGNVNFWICAGYAPVHDLDWLRFWVSWRLPFVPRAPPHQTFFKMQANTNKDASKYKQMPANTF